MSFPVLLRTALFAVALLPAHLLADAVVTFNEVNYNPVVSQDAEWIELHNQMSVNVDLSGWSLANGITYTFGSGTVIPAGGFLVVAKNPANAALTGVPGVLGPFSGNLSNSGETLELLSRSGRLMDRVTYGDTGEWPIASDGVGATLAKRLPGTDSENAASWTASLAPGGTPAAANFAPPGTLIRHTWADENSVWRYNDSNTAPAANWNTNAFNDAAWPTGQALFGTASSTPVLTVTANLTERYRAGAITGVANAATFSQWTDTATSDGSTQSATAGGNPTYRTNATPTAEPVVRFDGNDEFRTTLSPGISPSSGFVYFIVCKAISVPDNSDYIFDRNHTIADAPLVSLKASNGHYQFQKRDDSNNGLGGPVSTSLISTTQFQIVALRRNTVAGRFEIWVDGVMEGTTDDPGDNLTPQPIVIGRHAVTVSAGFNGDIAEMLVYKSALSDAEFQSAGAYLEARYGLTTAYPNTTVVTPLAAATPTSYFRKTFTFTGDPSRTELRLDQTVADGAIFYLNGQELTRTNLPAGTISHGTAALSNVPQPLPSGFQTLSSSSLVSGTNVLAVSLHKAAADPSAYFSASLAGTETPADPGQSQTLRLNEIAGASDPSFFIELRNNGATTTSLVGCTLGISGGASFALPASSLTAGAVVSFTEAQLGFRPLVGDKIVLLATNAAITDVQIAAAAIGGRSDAYPGQWLRPSAPTPGGLNQFALTNDIVINEICYKAPELPSTPGTPPVTSSIPLVSYGTTWRYNQSGAILGSNWAASAHAVGSGWQSGPGTLAFSNNALPLAIGTALNSPASNNPFVITYYFETDINLSAANAANLSSVTLSHLIDDGAVIYLNGVELTRFNVPVGTVTAATLANPGVTTAAVVGPVTLTVPSGTAVTGTNRISVEVHQSSTSSSDLVFGLQGTATVVTTPGVPEFPAAPSLQQWIELYNRGTSAVNLSAWKFAAGIGYTFASGTTLAPGARVVVARDPFLIPPAPGLTVLGPWSGSLSGSGERILLQDASGNPADEVSYVDGGRWPGTPDGGGSTLELRDPHSDNSLPESWAASDETARRSWQTYTYQGVAAASSVGPDGQWREFILGLLDEGEVLLDDITVTENPGASGVSMISGGNFESGTGGWRFLGNHSDARIVTDPANASNHALYLHSTGATEHMHNHVETTFPGALSVVNGRTYQISFKARWISGCNKLNTRLYFNRLPRTTVLPRTQVLGTPGLANSTVSPNIGPGFTFLNHSPAVPEPGETVTVTARASDPDGLGALTLYYSPSGGAFTSVPMTPTGDGATFTAHIPGYAAASVVRFYVAATDAAAVPATSYFPAEGALAHAIYQVNDGLAATNGLNNIRIIMAPADESLLYQANNLMSNDRIGCTVIYRENEIYYNAGVRLKSSQRGRQNSARVGFNLSFNDDQLFRGIHSSIAIDRSEGQITGAQEILYDHMMYASGGIPAESNDLVKVIAPNPAHTSTAILQMARFGPVYLDSQFDHGADGTVYEYELIYYPTTADANGYKLPQPDSVVGVGMTSLGDDKESYRWSYLTKNSEDKDDYSRVIAMTKQFDKTGTAFDSTVNDVLDVDQWLRALAYSCASGAGDSFFVNSQHNGQFFARPSDGRVLYFPHDLDYAYNATLPIFTSNELQKLTADPARRRAYLGHLYDICTTVFNQSYMSAWTTHYGSLLPNEDFPGHLSYINTRSNYILSAINADTAPVTFAITTNGGANFATNDTPVALAGQGWVNVRNIRLAGSTTPLGVTWTSSTAWSTVVSVGAGANVINLEAVDFNGQVVGADSITITNSGSTQLPASNNLVVSEIYYHPLVQSGNSEYIELQNISTTATIDMSGLAFTQGIGFTFANGASLAPGAKVVVIKNTVAFQNEFGTGRPVSTGLFTGSLANEGETITLRRADSTLVRTFDYGVAAPWPTLPSNSDYSLVLVNPFSNPDHSDPLSWRASTAAGGSPGASDSVDYAAWKATYGNPADNLDADGDGLTTLAEYYLGGNPNVADQGLAPTYTLEAGNTLLLSITRPADVAGLSLVPESSNNVGQWQPAAGVVFVSNDRLPGSPARDRLTFRIPSPNGSIRFFVRFAIH
ncbi:MAG: lamin tail domain-containing protein [Luteolibacter sp.]|uniref:lamin tail domain-containing protein n=1 Tax=Luteolibacter sp. TaxID=1962973 RepID=UPI003267CD08